MQTVNIDSNDFGEIRSRGYVYVDKTAWLNRLARPRGGRCSSSRARAASASR
ncbi:MAG: hypothetical protein IJJ84_14355 [Kiritimatiellae bacterium]|nr:hypothetical protein [Kiritimatiellia bacterium]